MRGLAFKIFLSFWLIFAVLIASFALLPDAGQGIRLQDHLRGHGTVAAELYGQAGPQRCDEYVATVAHTIGLRFALFDLNATAVCRPPGDDVSDLRRAFPSTAASSSTTGSSTMVYVRTPSGGTFAVVGTALPAFDANALVPSFPYRAVALAIVISGLVCFAMARYLARPLRLVRNTSYRLAAGDLQARAGPAVGGRRDEIGDLVRDFDAMAGRIEALVDAQNQLLSDISHELRSPLARLNVALELARRKASVDMTTDLNRIEIEAERMNELIGRVLGLARAENNPQAMSAVELESLVREVAEDAQYEAQRQDKSVELLVRASPATLGHAPLIASAVDNVVRNGLRCTPPGSTVTVTLDVINRDARISVRDHGPGVPVAELERIFSPFYRVESGRNRETGGVGLGLAIARRAVTIHHGTISAENVGDGLCVTIRLPLRPMVDKPQMQ